MQQKQGILRDEPISLRKKKDGHHRCNSLQEVRGQMNTDLTREIMQKVREIPGAKEVACHIDVPYYS